MATQSMRLADRIKESTVDVMNGEIFSENDGIALVDGIRQDAEVTIMNVDISSERDDAIDVSNEIRDTATLNIAGGTLNAGKNGIELALVAGDVNIGAEDKTTTINADQDGIASEGLWLGPYENGSVDITNVDVNAGDNGVNLNNVNTTSITDSTITAGERGVSVFDGGNTEITGNVIEDVGADGVNVAYTRTVDVSANEITNTYDDGIQVIGGNTANITDNIITDAGSNTDNPGELADSNLADGINVFVFESADIINNTIENSKDDGIEVIGRGSFSREEEGIFPTQILIDQNDIDVSGDNGIAIVSSGKFSEILGDVVNSEITNNTVDNSGNNGLVAQGSGHQQVVLVGNEFTDNPTGARFESGAIDLTGETNTFTVTPEFEAPEGFDFVTGVQFDIAKPEDPASLTIVDETLGTTVFDGYGSRPVGEAFYVRFEDGAILDELGNVIEIDGESANFDGVIPSTVPGFLFNSPQLLDIEARLFDADDAPVNGRGQIFENLGAPLSPEDFLQERGFGQFGTSGLDVTVLGLPAIDGAGLNNIQPAAGEGAEGTSGDDLASIEPAAGGEDASCWGDAIDAASAGAPVTYSFGTAFGEVLNDLTSEQSLNDATTCSSTFQ